MSQEDNLRRSNRSRRAPNLSDYHLYTNLNHSNRNHTDQATSYQDQSNHLQSTNQPVSTSELPETNQATSCQDQSNNFQSTNQPVSASESELSDDFDIDEDNLNEDEIEDLGIVNNFEQEQRMPAINYDSI